LVNEARWAYLVATFASLRPGSSSDLPAASFESQRIGRIDVGVNA
jgi:hypothetical protein